MCKFQLVNGCWLDFPKHLDLDALYGLVYMRKLTPGYCVEEIDAAARKYGNVVMRSYKEYFASGPDAHLMLSLAGTFGLLQQLLPIEYIDTV